jgi:hypothetical protein
VAFGYPAGPSFSTSGKDRLAAPACRSTAVGRRQVVGQRAGPGLGVRWTRLDAAYGRYLAVVDAPADILVELDRTEIGDVDGLRSRPP